MGQLVLDLIPVALGVVLSPLAIMALVAVLLSRLARVNGVAYLLGWAAGIVGVLALFLWLFAVLEIHDLREPPLWVAVVRILVAVLMIGGAIWVYRRGAARIHAVAQASSPREIAAAVPSLPGWLQAVESFRPVRTFFLGAGLFVLNPVDLSCGIIAALDISLAPVSAPGETAATIGFALVGILPIAIPVLYVVVRGARAQPLLDRLRTWIAGNTHVLNAALLLVIGALQLQKGLSALL